VVDLTLEDGGTEVEVFNLQCQPISMIAYHKQNHADDTGLSYRGLRCKVAIGTQEGYFEKCINLLRAWNLDMHSLNATN